MSIGLGITVLGVLATVLLNEKRKEGSVSQENKETDRPCCEIYPLSENENKERIGSNPPFLFDVMDIQKAKNNYTYVLRGIVHNTGNSSAHNVRCILFGEPYDGYITTEMSIADSLDAGSSINIEKIVNKHIAYGQYHVPTNRITGIIIAYTDIHNIPYYTVQCFLRDTVTGKPYPLCKFSGVCQETQFKTVHSIAERIKYLVGNNITPQFLCNGFNVI